MLAPVNQVRRVLRESDAALRAADLPTQMIHGSFIPGNIIIGTGGATITDFDRCHVAPRALDVAMAFVTFTHGSEIVDGYRGFEPAEWEAFWPAVRRVLIHLRLGAGVGPNRIVEELTELNHSIS